MRAQEPLKRIFFSPRNTEEFLRPRLCLCVPDRLEFQSVVCGERGKPKYSDEKKPLEAGERNNNKLNPQMESTPGCGPRPHWWEASAVTIAKLSPTPPLYLLSKKSSEGVGILRL